MTADHREIYKWLEKHCWSSRSTLFFVCSIILITFLICIIALSSYGNGNALDDSIMLLVPLIPFIYLVAVWRERIKNKKLMESAVNIGATTGNQTMVDFTTSDITRDDTNKGDDTPIMGGMSTGGVSIYSDSLSEMF
jgi:hypothetical protein|uniref:Uncharacterized protein n=1 Tax=viral metagenome TaxID=1070528 RepID=A0A6C0IWQ5_9ZZZZ